MNDRMVKRDLGTHQRNVFSRKGMKSRLATGRRKEGKTAIGAAEREKEKKEKKKREKECARDCDTLYRTIEKRRPTS
jgi:hypothetical protein